MTRENSLWLRPLYKPYKPWTRVVPFLDAVVLRSTVQGSQPWNKEGTQTLSWSPEKLERDETSEPLRSRHHSILIFFLPFLFFSHTPRCSGASSLLIMPVTTAIPHSVNAHLGVLPRLHPSPRSCTYAVCLPSRLSPHTLHLPHLPLLYTPRCGREDSTVLLKWGTEESGDIYLSIMLDPTRARRNHGSVVVGGRRCLLNSTYAVDGDDGDWQCSPNPVLS